MPPTIPDRPAVTFSVVVPLYNKGPHIERAIRSALSQTLPPAEIVVVDDGSTDGGFEYVAGLRDDRIRLHRRTEPGPGGYAARNLAIERATSEWIAFLDADDEWLPEHLAGLASAIESSDRSDGRIVCAFTGYRIAYDGGRSETDIYTRFRNGGTEPATYGFEAFMQLWLDVGGSPVWTSATAIRRDALIEAGLFPAGRCTRGGDKDLWLRVAQAGLTIGIPALTAVYWKDSVNMVTRIKDANARHCMCDTITAMIAGVPDVQKSLMKKLINLEVYKYAIRTAKSARLSREAWSGFNVAESPAHFLALTALSSPLAWQAVRFANMLRERLRGRPRHG